MEKDYLTIIKLGGSTVTLKNKPLSANLPVIMELGKIIKQITTPLIIVHGGGSFGHHFASKWGLSTSPQNANPQAIVETRTLDYMDTYTCYADFGIGIILKRNNRLKLLLDLNDFSRLKFCDYYNNFKKYMNVIEFKELENLF